MQGRGMSEIIIKKLAEYKGIEVPKPRVEVSDADVNMELERARTFAAHNDDKGDEPAENGDVVTIDFTGYFDGEPFQGGSGTFYPLQLGSGKFIPGFEEQLIGAVKGEERDVTVTFPENYPESSCAGREALFKVKIEKVESVTIPELSDEVVQQVSECTTVDEFREYVRSEILRSRENSALRGMQTAILEKIVASSEIEVPEEEIVQRAAVLKQSLVAELENNGMSFGSYLAQNQLSQEEFEKYNRYDAESMLKGQAVLNEIAIRENLTVSKEELNYAIQSMMQTYHLSLDELKQVVGLDYEGMLHDDIVAQKALQFLISHAVELDCE